jgi:hypothetical protein
MHLDQQQHSRERCTPSRNTHLTSLCMSHISSILIKYSSCKFLSLLHYLHPICILYLHNGASIEGLAGLAGLRVLRVLRVLQVCGSWGSADLAGLAGLRVLRVLRVLRDVYNHSIIYTVYAHRFYDIGRYRLFIFY